MLLAGIALVASATPASAGPFRFDDRTPLAPYAALTDLPALPEPKPETMRDTMPATCARNIGEAPDMSGAVPAAGAVRFDVNGYLSIDTDITQSSLPESDADPSGDAAEPADAVVTLPAAAANGDGAFLSAGLLGCTGASASSAEVAGNVVPPTPVNGRLRAAVQAVAMTASLVLITLLAFLVAAMTRKSSHAGSRRSHRLHRS